VHIVVAGRRVAGRDFSQGGDRAGIADGDGVGPGLPHGEVPNMGLGNGQHRGNDLGGVVDKVENTIPSAGYAGGIGDGGRAAVHIYVDGYGRVAGARLKSVGVVTDDESGKLPGTIPTSAVGCGGHQIWPSQTVSDGDRAEGGQGSDVG